MNYKNMFPMFKNNKKIVYFDNSALTFKPYQVINAMNNFYSKYSISTRTSDSILGIKINNLVNETRKNIASFINANEDEIIFTSGTTESLNLIAKMLSNIISDGEILLSFYNHSSNIVPFLETFNNIPVKIKYFLDEDDLIKNINSKTKIISLPAISNNFNVNYDLDKIYAICKEKNIILINDAAQAIAHKKTTLLNSDVLVFSGNKLYGPTGIGILAVKKWLLNNLKPQKWGGGQVQNINYESWNSKSNINKFEPGTLNFSGIIGLNESINFLKKITYERINFLEREIANYFYDELSKVKNVKIASNRGDLIILFNINNIPSQDVASYLGHKNIYVRSGVFCAHMFNKNNRIKYDSSYVRASISFYNTKKDVDVFVKILKEGGDFIDFLFG